MDIDRSHRTYLVPEDIDQLVRQNTNLMAELWIVKDRLAILEHVLQEKGILQSGQVDDLDPEGSLAQWLDEERAAYVERVVGIDPNTRTAERLKQRAVTTPK